MLIALMLPRDLEALTTVDLVLRDLVLVFRFRCADLVVAFIADRAIRSCSANSVGISIEPLLKYREFVKYMPPISLYLYSRFSCAIGALLTILNESNLRLCDYFIV